MNKTSLLLILCVVALLSVVGFLVYDRVLYTPSTPPPDYTQTACTMEAKQCSDGSYVGRTGPKCEFTPCPTPSVTGTESWKTSTTGNVSFRYPEQLGTTYVNTIAEWPPTLQVVASSVQPFSCAYANSVTISGKLYCVKTTVEGAAGSTYTTYEYSTEVNKNVYTFKFTLRAPQCSNYDEPKKTECTNEENTFSVDALVDKMVKTIKIASVQ